MMNKLIPSALVLGLMTCLHAETPAAPATPATPAKEAPALPAAEVKTNCSYALGFQAGTGFNQQYGLTSDDLDQESYIKGLMESLKGATKPSLSEEKIQAAMQAFGKTLQARMEEKAKSNLEAGKKFLDENGKRKGVTTTKSGLQYEVINKGGAEKYVAPKEGDKTEKQFLVNYKGTLIDGTVFDQSPEGKPVPMTLQVIPGFKEAITTMPVGAKWKLFIPSDLAYGERGAGGSIKPNSTLIFELELVKIENAPAAPEAPAMGGTPEGMSATTEPQEVPAAEAPKKEDKK